MADSQAAVQREERALRLVRNHVAELSNLESRLKALFLEGAETYINAMLKHEQIVFGFTPFNANPAEMTFDLHD